MGFHASFGEKAKWVRNAPAIVSVPIVVAGFKKAGLCANAPETDTSESELCDELEDKEMCQCHLKSVNCWRAILKMRHLTVAYTSNKSHK